MKTLAAISTWDRVWMSLSAMWLAAVGLTTASMTMLVIVVVITIASAIRGTQYLMAESRRNELRVRRARRMARVAR